MKQANLPIRYHHYTEDNLVTIDTDVIVETPVTLTVNGDNWLTFMCTPVHLEAMAVGFLYNEGLILSMEDVANVRLCAAGDHVDVWLHKSVEQPKKWRRTSGCSGGMTSVQEDLPSPVKVNGSVLHSDRVGELISLLFGSQELYRTTGGVHTSALSDGEHIILSAEDIGRHNTLDKLSGMLLFERIIMPRKIILTTGRISSEMLQKATRMGASTLISRTSPSSLSIELAERHGITLIGYARRSSFNVYTHPERITVSKSPARSASIKPG